MAAKQGEMLKLLVIDDDEEIRYALKAVFQSQGWDMAEAGNVVEGVELFREYRPDIVLIDYYMPRTNGIRGVELLREEDPNVPLIVFTIDDSLNTVDRFMKAGATDFVLKPVKAPDIISRIRLHVRLLDSLRERGDAGGSESAKGIGQSTLERIEKYLRSEDGFVTVEEVAQHTGLSEQTAYRYLQYLAAGKRVKVCQNYGKIGRPKQLYRLEG